MATTSSTTEMPPSSPPSFPLSTTTTAIPIQLEPTPALATTKRKFHRLLESLTKAPSSKRPNESFSFADSPAKRIRLEARSRLEAQSLLQANSSTSTHTRQSPAEVTRARVQSQLLKTRLEAAKSTSSLNNTPQPEPNYVPWSHAAFLKRLNTFANVRLWSSKPDAINEVAWAKRGWICVGLNTVACKGGCEERVVVTLRPPRKDEHDQDIDGTEDFSAEVSDELAGRVESLIVDAHTEECLWRGHGCENDIYRLPIARQAIWGPQLQTRYKSFLTSSTLPPSSNVICPTDICDLAKLLPPDFQESTLPNSESSCFNDTALAFSVLGWSLSSESTPAQPIATCDACFRRLGLWLYASPPATSPESADPESSMSLSLVSSHRTYCPWVNAESQHQIIGSLAGLSGWEVLVRCIENAAGFLAAGESTCRPSSSLSSHPGFVEDGLVANEDANDQNDGVQASHWRPRSDSVASYASKSKEELEKEDKARFARLRELTKSIGLKGLRAKLNRAAYR